MAQQGTTTLLPKAVTPLELYERLKAQKTTITMSPEVARLDKMYDGIESLGSDDEIFEPFNMLIKKAPEELEDRLWKICQQLDLRGTRLIRTIDDIVEASSQIISQLAEDQATHARRRTLAHGIRVVRFIFRLRTAVAVAEREKFLEQRKYVESLLPDEHQRDELPWNRAACNEETDIGGFLTQLPMSFASSSSQTSTAGDDMNDGLKRQAPCDDETGGPVKRRGHIGARAVWNEPSPRHVMGSEDQGGTE